MTRSQTTLVLCLIAWATWGCGGSGRSPVIARINGGAVYRSDFDRFLALKLGEFTGPEVPDALQSQMLDEYVRRRLVLDEAAEAGLAISDAEIEQAAAENPQLKSAAASPDMREELADHLLVEKYYSQVVLREVQITTEEVQKYIEQNQSRLTERPGFYVREIRAQSREEAERLREEVTTGGGDFAAVARLHSDAPSAEQGGLARYDEGQLPEVLEKAIRPLQPGDVSAVIKSSYGFHVFKLERRIQPYPGDSRRSQLDERRAQLAEEFAARKNQQIVDEALDRLVKSAAIKINQSALGFTYTGELGQN
ncbi:MAG TPA: peptidylprolyl isomerase [Blastocatellia bacterium]|nr:peptidylprolyl isomerase [Blastocatellia bacterium]